MNEPVSEVVARNTKKFDHMPVVDSTAGAIVGVVQLSDYYSSPVPAGTVADHMVRLNENHLIGADASILSFVRTADHRPFRLVVSSDGVLGLLSLSGIQALPVRACLFSLVTGLEITMSQTIDAAHRVAETCRKLLSEERQQKLADEIQKAKAGGGIVSELLFTQFADMITILKKSILLEHPERNVTVRQLRAIEDLRNKVAHAKDYAPDADKAREVCVQARKIIQIRNLLTNIKR